MINRSDEFIEAAKIGDIEKVNQLLASKQIANIDAQDNRRYTSYYNQTALMCAAENGHEKVVALLLGYGAKIDNVNNLGRNVIHFAAKNNRLEIIRFLFNQPEGKKAIDNQSRMRETAISIAAGEGHVEVVRFLIAKGAKIDRNTLISAIMSNRGSKNLEVIHLLLEDPETTNKIINMQSSVGISPLYWAIVYGVKEIVCFLIDKGADVNDTFVLDHAIEFHRKEILRELLIAGAIVTKATVAYAQREANDDRLNRNRKLTCDEIVNILEEHMKEVEVSPQRKRNLTSFFSGNDLKQSIPKELIDEIDDYAHPIKRVKK